MKEQRFGFAIVNVGTENALKAEVGRLVPAARPAFARPGLITWKHEAADARFAAESVLARVRGLSLGMAKSEAEVLDRVDAHGEGPYVLHVFARDATEDGPAEADVARAVQLEAALRALGGARFVDRTVPAASELVIDVVVAGDEPMLVGVHQHRRDHWPLSGGRPKVVVPAGAPERGYRKLEEVVAWAGVTLDAGSTVVELGAAPGGTALALASRGVNVSAIDPATMASRVLAFVGPGGARVRHVKKPAGGVDMNDVPRDTTTLFIDLDLEPAMVFRYFARLLALAPSATLVVLTFRVRDREIADDLPRAVARIRELGFADVRVSRLPSNRDEVTFVARRTLKKPAPRRDAGGRGRPVPGRR